MNSDRHSGNGKNHGSTSRTLLGKIIAGDESAWERFVKLYTPLIVYWCRQSPLSENDIADIYQEVFQSVARKIRTFRKSNSSDSLRGWLRVITRNKIHDRFRKSLNEPDGVGGTEMQLRMQSLQEVKKMEAFTVDELPDEVEESSEKQVLLAHTLERIKTDFAAHTWEAFEQTTLHGRSPSDVALDMEMSPVSVRVAKSRILKRLRSELSEEFFDI